MDNEGFVFLVEQDPCLKRHRVSLPVVLFRVSFISLGHQLLLGVSVRSASLEGDQVVHRVSMSVSRQASRLSFHREATEGSA